MLAGLLKKVKKNRLIFGLISGFGDVDIFTTFVVFSEQRVCDLNPLFL